MPEDFRKYAVDYLYGEAQRALDSATAAAGAEGAPSAAVQCENDHPHQSILETAQSRGCGLIVMASHGRRGISALVLGSETMKVLTHSTVPVLVCR